MNLEKKDYITMSSDLSQKGVMRIQACFKLMNIADSVALEGIYHVLRTDPCELVRHEAAFTLGEVASDEAVDVLREVLVADDSMVVKHECLMSLGTIGTPKDIELIETYLDDPRTEVSSSAKISLERIKQTEDFELTLTHKDVDKKILSYQERLLNPVKNSQNDRIQILFQLMRVGTDDVVNTIFDSLINDPCEVVRHEAAFVLGEIATPRAIFCLEEALRNHRQKAIVQHEALFALGSTGNQNVLSFLASYFNDEEYIVSESAKIAYDRISLLKNPYRGTEEFKELN